MVIRKVTDPFYAAISPKRQKKDKVALIIYNSGTVCSFSQELDNTVKGLSISGLYLVS